MNQNCAKCGNPVDATARFCPECGQQIGQALPADTASPTAAHLDAASPPPLPNQQPPYIPNNLAIAIVAIVFCWPLGIPAVVYAAQVDGLARTGQYEAAWQTADSAKKWSMWAIGAVIAGAIIYFLIFLLMFGFTVLVPAITH